MKGGDTRHRALRNQIIRLERASLLLDWSASLPTNHMTLKEYESQTERETNAGGQSRHGANATGRASSVQRSVVAPSR